MLKWLIALAIILTSTAIGIGVQHHYGWQTANRVKAVSCLKTIGAGLLLYSNEQKSPFPNQSSATAPATRPVVIYGCSKNHDADGKVLYADGDAGFAVTQSTDNIYATTQPVSVWDLLVGGQCVIVLRHCKTDDATADAASINFADRSTQRNLSAAGIEQAKAIGRIFKDRKIPIGRVLCSEFARCKESAELAFGKAQTEPALDALHDSQSQLVAMERLMQTVPSGGNLVLVTHQTNLLATTRLVPGMGEAVIVQPMSDGTYQVVGALAFKPTTDPRSSE